MAYPTRFTARGLPDGKCWARPCMQPGEDKGAYTPGRGYTHYHAVPRPVCTRNHLYGCPHPIPEYDPENARCCFRPNYKRQGKAPRSWRECLTCGAHAPLKAAKRLNGLPTVNGVPCRHQGEGSPTLLIDWFQCEVCWGIWDHQPVAFEPGQFLMDELLRAFDIRRGIVPKSDAV